MRFDDHVPTALPYDVNGYESALIPSPRQRETLELRISATHLRFGMPDRDIWWVDTPIADLGFDRAVVQFGHHSYNPQKPGTLAPIGHDTSEAGTGNPSPGTWHWDAFSIAPARRFEIIPADRRYVLGSAPETVTLARPAPKDAMLQFAALGDAEVSFDGGPFSAARRQDGSREAAGAHEDAFCASFWTPIPQGTRTVDVRLTANGIWATYNLDTMAKDFSVWHLPATGVEPGELLPEAAPPVACPSGGLGG